MAEPDQVLDNEVARLQEDREDGENEEHALSELQNAKSAAELNLIIAFLSLCSSQNSEEGLTIAKNEEEKERHKAKASIKKVQKSRREIDEVKPVRRRTTERFKTTVRDSRNLIQLNSCDVQARPKIMKNNGIQGGNGWEDYESCCTIFSTVLCTICLLVVIINQRS